MANAAQINIDCIKGQEISAGYIQINYVVPSQSPAAQLGSYKGFNPFLSQATLKNYSKLLAFKRVLSLACK